MSCIYILTNKINNKKYVGQTTKTFKRRLRKHIQNSKKSNSNQIISKAIKKYGIDNFDRYVFECNVEDLDYLETETIKILNTTNNGYNISFGGNNKKLSDSTKKKITIAATGRNLSEKTKLRMSKERKGQAPYIPNAKTKKKMSKSKIGNKHNFYSKKHSESTTKKMSESAKGRIGYWAGKVGPRAKKVGCQNDSP